MRRDAKRDANEREIIDALEDAQCLVQQLSGKGIPDLLIRPQFAPWWAANYRAKDRAALIRIVDRLLHERLVLQEVKNDDAGGRLTPDQLAWIAKGWPVEVVVDKYEALYAVGLRRG